MHAGASAVVANLWTIRDEATAQLMARFYDGLFATYERQLREQMLFDEQLANLAARQRETLHTRRLLPVLPLGHTATGSDLHA